MTRDDGISTIFGRRARTPSVVVTNENPDGSTAINQVPGASNPASTTASVPNGPYSAVPQTPSVTEQTTTPNEDQNAQNQNQNVGTPSKLKACGSGLCSEPARKIYMGVVVTVLVTLSWVGATHCIKYLYLRRPQKPNLLDKNHENQQILPSYDNVTISVHPHLQIQYNAPFFTTWFCTNWTMLFFPVYVACRCASEKCHQPMTLLNDSLRSYRDKGFTLGRFMTRCAFFCMLWVATNYMYVHALRILLATDVMALFATNVSCVYLLSWVILHEQFVGIRIVAVILCDTGIALLAYMDGITGSPTLGGVVLAASAAAGSAVYKVLFRKAVGGDATYAQVAVFFSLVGLLNLLLLWPIAVALPLSGAERLDWKKLPWIPLLSASGLSLLANLLGNFSVALTYDLFITLGLITAVPVSAALDVVLYGAHFAGMKLAGIILIAVGFFLVMFPENWPDYITRLLRNIIMLSHNARRHARHTNSNNQSDRRSATDYRTGYIRSHLRSPSGRVR